MSGSSLITPETGRRNPQTVADRSGLLPTQEQLRLVRMRLQRRAESVRRRAEIFILQQRLSVIKCNLRVRRRERGGNSKVLDSFCRLPEATRARPSKSSFPAELCEGQISGQGQCFAVSPPPNINSSREQSPRDRIWDSLRTAPRLSGSAEFTRLRVIHRQRVAHNRILRADLLRSRCR